MKKLFLSFTIVAILVSFGCKNKFPKYNNVAEQITYSVGLEQQAGSLPILEDFKSKDFVDNILSEIENKKIQAYKFSLKEKFPISFQDIKANFDASNKKAIVENLETGLNEERIIESKIQSQEVKDFMFIENWIYDETSSTIEKKVSGLSAIRTYSFLIGDSLEEIRQNIPFTVYFNDNNEMPSTAKLICPRAEYVVRLSECDSLFTSFAKLDSKTMIKTMIDNVLNQDIKVFDYFNLEKTKLTVEQVKQNFGAGVETIEVEDEKTGKMIKKTVKGEINLDQIIELVFIEEWYFDETNFSFYKKIIAYGPVREYDRQLGEMSKVKTVPFLIYQ